MLLGCYRESIQELCAYAPPRIPVPNLYRAEGPVKLHVVGDYLEARILASDKYISLAGLYGSPR